MTQEALGPEDYESVQRAEELLRARGLSQRITLNEATTAWRQLVDQVEGGYGWCVDEYTNDLTARDWLDEAWPVLTSRVRAAREPELAAIDARFRAATTDDDGELLAHFFRVGRRSGWWWRRRPLHLVGQFAEDARRAGVL